jgi:hypothetical protein
MFQVFLISVLNRRFIVKITLIARRNIRENTCAVVGRQGITLPEGTVLYCSYDAEL